MLRPRSAKIVKVIIKDPLLRRLRHNLRQILYLWYERESKDILDFKHSFTVKRVAGTLQESDILKEREVVRQLNELDKAYNRSILVCRRGADCRTGNNRDLDKDMVWNIDMGGWHCLKCFNYYPKKIPENWEED